MEFGESEYAVKYYLVDVYNLDSPDIWQKGWTNQIVDGDDGLWNSVTHLQSFAITATGLNLTFRWPSS